MTYSWEQLQWAAPGKYHSNVKQDFTSLYLIESATNRNGHTPKRTQTRTDTSQNGHSIERTRPFDSAANQTVCTKCRDLVKSNSYINGHDWIHIRKMSLKYESGYRWLIISVTSWLDWIGLDLFNDDTCPTEHISRHTQVGSLTAYNRWQFISDRRIRLLVKIPLCKSRESSQRGSSKSQQCSIHPEFPAELHIPRACGQWSTSVHNDGKEWEVLRTRYGTSWPWYDQFEAGWWQPPQLLLGAEISWVDLVLASRDRDLCHVRTHPIWSEPAAGYRSWLMALNLLNGLLPMGQCHGQGTPLLTGQLFHFPQCHSGLVSSRNEHVCLYHSIATGGSWYSRWEGSQYLPPQSLASMTLSQSRLQHHVALAPCADNSPVPEWWQ